MIPNSEAVRAGDLIFFGGIAPMDGHGVIADSNDIERQTETIIRRMARYLSAEGLSLEHLVSVTVYLSDIRLYDRMNAVYARLMPSPLPPRKVIQGPMTIDGMVVEMTAVASAHPPRVLVVPGWINHRDTENTGIG